MVVSVVASVKKPSKLRGYFRKHSQGFGAAIGIFQKKNKRKVAGSSIISSNIGYGSRLNKTRRTSFLTNAQIASRNIRGYKAEKYTVPSRNFFKVAAEPKFWERQNFGFLKEFYKANVLIRDCEKRLGNLGVIILRRAINDSEEYEDNSEFTVDKKGFNKPLIASGQMLKAIDWKSYMPGGRGNG